MAELKNELAWSKSRDDTLKTCARQYYYQYYGSWGGWEATASESARKLYVLKQLKTRPVWAGERVHICVERSLNNLRRGIAVLSPDKIADVTLNQMREDYRSSLARNYWKKPKSCALFEHEYGVPVPREAWQQTAEDVRTCLHTFYTSELFAELRAVPRDAWLQVEELDKFALDATPIWAKIDCSFRDGARVRIYDWKTGRSLADASTLQLVCYCLHAQTKWGVAIENVLPAEFYLLVNRIQHYQVKAGDVEAARAYIRASVADMHSLLADTARNEPLAEGAFAKTPNERSCLRCNFIGPCRPDLLPRLKDAREG
ncbi:MAG: PD-(D/E)XK nuclease family protein [Planctomycetes bacterium]|nr:PD-(D/E)XK nuclease family protein [Planctomycetota bacterium]